MFHYQSIDKAVYGIGHTLLARGKVSGATKWQSTEAPDKMFATPFIDFSVPVPEDKNELAKLSGANLPWAEDHFQERISGIPWNPPPSNDYWPYAQKSNKEFKINETFSHTYPERFFPTEVNDFDAKGIRFKYGDYRDVINLLDRDPHTRQAYLPIWFPEDTGAVHGERVPCSLGYLFTLWQNYFHITYYIRSCDYNRHFRDDVYMAGRLAQNTLAALKAKSFEWSTVEMGMLRMHIGNLHIFNSEVGLLTKKLNREIDG